MPLMLLRTGDFGRQDLEAERFMRPSVGLENDDPLRLVKLYAPRVLRPVPGFHKFRSAMTREHILQIARATVEKEGWPWREPVRVKEFRRSWLFGGRHRWHIITNIDKIGCNAWVEVDDETGEVTNKGFSRR